jgi:molybdopterin-guanine dinucleotide biosynthesis protein A
MSAICPEISGAVLAKASSRRLGCRKPFFELGGRTLIGRVLKTMRRFFDEILIVTDEPALFSGIGGVLAVQDLIPGCGPLGGIYTGLKESSKEKVFFTGCDMPFLHSGLIRRILRVAQEGNIECVIPSAPKGIEPLHGVYSRSTLGVIEERLGGGEFSVHKLFPRVSCRCVKAKDDELVSFYNVNTIRDLISVRRVPGRIFDRLDERCEAASIAGSDFFELSSVPIDCPR